jgi:large subunit ribosomal protein L23
MAIFSRKKEDEKKDGSDQAEVKVEKNDPAKVSMKDLYEGGGKTVSQEVTKDGTKEVVKRKTTGIANRILIKPMVTEKATNLGVENKYVFVVNVRSNKIDIAKAIEEAYGIKPVSVNIINNIGKEVRYGRIKGQRKDWKKAIVKLPAGKTIKVYEGV